MSRPVHGDLVLLHRFQEGGLGTRRRPVHLVDQHHVGEQGPGPKRPGPVHRRVHRGTGDVGGQQVGGALHPAETPAHRGGQALGQQGLTGTGQVFHQQVTPGQQGGHRQADLGVLTPHRGGHRLHQGPGQSDGAVELLSNLGFHHGH